MEYYLLLLFIINLIINLVFIFISMRILCWVWSNCNICFTTESSVVLLTYIIIFTFYFIISILLVTPVLFNLSSIIISLPLILLLSVLPMVEVFCKSYYSVAQFHFILFILFTSSSVVQCIIRSLTLFDLIYVVLSFNFNCLILYYISLNLCDLESGSRRPICDPKHVFHERYLYSIWWS